jgi:hypothetical protein
VCRLILLQAVSTRRREGAAVKIAPAPSGKLQAQALAPVFDTPEEPGVDPKERDGSAAFIRRNGIVQEE